MIEIYLLASYRTGAPINRLMQDFSGDGAKIGFRGGGGVDSENVPFNGGKLSNKNYY